MSRNIRVPTYRGGFATCAAESDAPHRWEGLGGAWNPGLGPTGWTLHEWGSGKKLNGTLAGGMDPATDWVPTEKGWGVDLRTGGTERVQHVAPCQNVAAFSFVLWHLTAIAGREYLGKWSGFANPGNDSQFLLRNSGSGAGNYNFYVRNAADDGGAVVSTAAKAVHGVWSFVAGVADGTHLHLYVRGGLTETTTPVALAGPYIPVSGDLWSIGKAHSGTPEGLVNSVCYFDRALLLPEIEQLFADPLAMYRPRPLVFPAAVAGGYTVPLQLILECAQ